MRDGKSSIINSVPTHTFGNRDRMEFFLEKNVFYPNLFNNTRKIWINPINVKKFSN